MPNVARYESEMRGSARAREKETGDRYREGGGGGWGWGAERERESKSRAHPVKKLNIRVVGNQGTIIELTLKPLNSILHIRYI
ncbi:MAG: hypothetical protein LGB02_06315 [Sulfurovum sp.]|nr:hypothetical protein [Sulfurovum sp.]